MPWVTFHSICQPPSRPDRRSGVRLAISNQKPHYIAQLGSISKISQETCMSRPERIPSYRPSIIPSCSPSHTPFQKPIPTHPLPHTQLTTRINLPPSLLPLAPSLLHLTHGLYQALGGHTGHTVFVFKAGSQSWIQSRMQS